MIPIPDKHDIDINKTRCYNFVKQSSDHYLQRCILFDNEKIQVMGSYALVASGLVEKDVYANDCDVFISCETQEEFQEIVKNIHQKIVNDITNRKDGNIRTYFDKKNTHLFEIDIYYLRAYNSKFQFVWIENYTHVQKANMFDMTCCMFRMVKNPTTDNLEVYANNTYVKELTSLKKMNITRKVTRCRFKKYHTTRGFEVNIDMVNGGCYFSDVYESYYSISNTEQINKARASWRLLYCVVKFKILNRRVIENVYAPGGNYYERVKENFYSVINN